MAGTDKAKRREYRLRYNERHPDRVRDYATAYRIRHLEETRAYKRAYELKLRPYSPEERAKRNIASDRCTEKASERPAVTIRTQSSPNDARMLTFLQLTEWHAHLFIGGQSKLVDTVSTMVWEYGKIGEVDSATGLGRKLGVGATAARGRMVHMRKYMPSIIAYAHFAGIMPKHTAYE